MALYPPFSNIRQEGRIYVMNGDVIWMEQLPRAMTLPRGELARRTAALHARLPACDLCPHRCGLIGTRARWGAAGSARRRTSRPFAIIMGRSRPFPARGGRARCLLAGCNLCCVYCQNCQISQGMPEEYPVYSAEALAVAFLALQERGCHNVNWVSPTHVSAQLAAALALAVPRGFSLPIVYNSNGYESLSALALLDGIVDIYLPDLKYADAEIAQWLSAAPDYPDIAIAAIREMFRQVGALQLDEEGIARRGVIVRHLVLPQKLAGSREILRRLAEEVSPEVTVSLMAQYYPAHRAGDVPRTRAHHHCCGI